MMTFKKWLLRSLYTLLGIVLILVTTLTILLTTETGNRLIVSQVHHFVPGEFDYEEYSGLLLRDFTIRGVRFRDEDLAIEATVAYLNIRWRPWELMQRKVHIRAFESRGIRVYLPEAEREPPEANETIFPIELPDIIFPVNLRIDQFEVTDVQFAQGDTLQEINRVSLRGRVRDNTVQLHSLVATTPEFHAQLHGQITPQGDYPVNLNNLIRVHLPEHGPVTVTGTLNGSTNNLLLRQQISGPISADIHVNVADGLTEALRWEGEIRAAQSPNQPLVDDIEQVLLELRGSGSLSALQGDLRIEGVHSEHGDFVVNTRAAYDPQGASLDTLFVRADALGLLIDWTGHADIRTIETDTGPEIQAIAASMGGETRFGDFAPADVLFSYQGNLTSAEAIFVQLKSDEATFSVAGNAQWGEGIEWDLVVRADPFELDSFVPETSGVMSVELVTQGFWGEEPDIRVDIATLAGNIQHPLGDYEIEASGQLRWSGDELESQNLRLTANDSLILADLWLSLSQTLARARVHGSTLAYEDWSVEELNADLELDWSLASLPVGTIDISRVQQNNSPLLDNLTIRSEREQDRYDLRIQGAGQQAEVDIHTSGTWRDMAWDGMLHQVLLAHPEAGNWRTTRESAMRFNQERVYVSRFCIERTRQNAGFCMDVDWDLESTLGTINADAQDIRLDLIQPLLPEQVQISGLLNGQVAIEILENRFTADGLIRISDSVVALPDQDIELRLRESDLLRFSGDQDELNLRFELLTADLEGGIQGTLVVFDALQNARIEGASELTLENLAFISILAPQLQAIQGRIAGDLSYSGDPRNPAIQGQIRLEEAGAEIPAAGITLRALNLEANAPGAEGEPFRLEATAESGDGSIRLSGQYFLLDQRAELRVEGANFQAMQTRDIALAISPNLNLVYTEAGLRVRGEVTVPRARITPPDFEQLDTSSRDTVIVQGDETIFTFEEQDLPIDADVQVILGDNVRVEAFGFAGQLTGRLRVIEQPGQPTTGVGNINVATGRYEIFGQPLDIERGSLVFTGGAINNPGLDLRVSRTIDVENVTVGARVAGTLREPNLSFFSTPAMQDSMVLSYLVLGRAPGEGSGEQNVFAQATLALGMRGGNFLGEQIGQAIGVDEVMLDATGENLENTSLFIGKHLSSRLYVRYGIGLIEPVSTFFIRYRLTDSLNFESQTSGERSGADLFFTIER
ncbi:translocation/assembly module TamB domain-containing protein [Aliidiomarina sanyensis]|uniref:Translocation and assembly module TamB C-terminal domain-containing protein n=1 Tax=Aliidiomarina sanyensis TaxID=1249555 RepID=A0A432WFV2_9GAMM|nr:translocation/assembly module TamB domain-containing protein [Aliidiomarina sanyensis]RUO32654.1 hypothetical protein CWE11_07705 [Aliidiomarina sanyensis]